MVSALYGSELKTPPSAKSSMSESFLFAFLHQAALTAGLSGNGLHPNIMATTRRAPARLPQKHKNQWISIFHTERRPCRTETVVYWGLVLDSSTKRTRISDSP